MLNLTSRNYGDIFLLKCHPKQVRYQAAPRAVLYVLSVIISNYGPKRPFLIRLAILVFIRFKPILSAIIGEKLGNGDQTHPNRQQLHSSLTTKFITHQGFYHAFEH